MASIRYTNLGVIDDKAFLADNGYTRWQAKSVDSDLSKTGTMLYKTQTDNLSAQLETVGLGDAKEVWLRFTFYSDKFILPYFLRLFDVNIIRSDKESNYDVSVGSQRAIIFTSMFSAGRRHKIVMHASTYGDFEFFLDNLQLINLKATSTEKSDNKNFGITGGALDWSGGMIADVDNSDNNGISNIILANYDCSKESLVEGDEPESSTDIFNRKIRYTNEGIVDVTAFSSDGGWSAVETVSAINSNTEKAIHMTSAPKGFGALDDLGLAYQKKVWLRFDFYSKTHILPFGVILYKYGLSRAKGENYQVITESGYQNAETLDLSSYSPGLHKVVIYVSAYGDLDIYLDDKMIYHHVSTSKTEDQSGNFVIMPCAQNYDAQAGTLNVDNSDDNALSNIIAANYDCSSETLAKNAPQPTEEPKEYISLFMNMPIEGKANGTLVSKNGDLTSPVESKVDAATENFNIFPLAVRCRKGWHAGHGCRVYTEGRTSKNWLFGLTVDGKFSSELELKENIQDKNVVFYVRVSASDELPKIDESVSIVVDAEVEAVEK